MNLSPELHDNKYFFKHLKKEVFHFLKENNISMRRPKTNLFQALCLFCLWIVLYAAFLFYGQMSPWLALALAVPWSICMLIIQLAVMHDASHGASSEKPWINKILMSSISFVGGSALLWESQHCHAHHSYTNIHKLDHDIDTGGLLRLHPSQILRPYHKYQYIYAWLLYPLFVLSWIWWGDFRDIKNNTYSISVQRMKKVIVEVFFIKIWHVAIFLALPALTFNSITLAVTCYLISFTIMGFFMVVIFQLAHMTGTQRLSENTEELSDDWAIRQIMTTANFAPDNAFLTWMLGGLNHQIEHHIFPKMSHFNYPKVRPHVEKMCQQRQLSYVVYPSVMAAVKGHQNHLIELGQDIS